MKRLLLPLLAALALPTAVSAKYLNLECKINFIDSKKTEILSINLNGNDTKITRSNDVLFAESQVKEGEIIILKREDAPDSVQSFYIINRVNGKLLYKNQVNKFTVGDPYYDENLVKQVKNLKPSKELPKSAIDALLNGSTSSGKCKKTKKVKTIF